MFLESRRMARQQPHFANVQFIALAEEGAFLTILDIFDFVLLYIRGEEFCILPILVY